MRKKLNKDISGDGGEERELVKELERLVNENNALLKVLKKITVEEKPPGSERPANVIPSKKMQIMRKPVEPAKRRK